MVEVLEMSCCMEVNSCADADFVVVVVVVAAVDVDVVVEEVI